MDARDIVRSPAILELPVFLQQSTRKRILHRKSLPVEFAESAVVRAVIGNLLGEAI